MVVISGKGMGHRYIVESTMRLLAQLNEWLSLPLTGDEEYNFIHDSASCYKARDVTAFQAEETYPFALMRDSYDMNSIENMYDLIKRVISKEIITAERQTIKTLIKTANCNKIQKPLYVEAIMAVISIM